MRGPVSIRIPGWAVTVVPVVAAIVSAAIGIGVAKATLDNHSQEIGDLKRGRDREMRVLNRIERNLTRVCYDLGIECEAEK